MDLVYIRPQQRRLQRRLLRLHCRPLQPLRLQQLPALPQVQLQVLPLVQVPMPQQRQRFSAILIMIGMVEFFFI